MWLYVDDSCIPWLLTLGKVFEGATILHIVAFPPDVVKVMAEKVQVHIDDIEVSMPTKEIINVAQAFQTFVT